MTAKDYALVPLALCCAMILAGLYDRTSSSIDSNRAAYARQQLGLVVENRNAPVTADADNSFTIHDELGGTIIEIETQDGYNGEIRFWLAISRQGQIRGVRVISHRETPGIGDVIDHSVSDWLDSFRGFSKSTQDQDWKLRADGGRFDHLSGATITTRATASAIRTALEKSDTGEDGPT